MQAADARAELCYMCNNATTQILCRSPAHPAAGCAGLLKIFSPMAPHISAVFLAAGHPTLLVLSCSDLQGRCVTPSHGHKPLFPFYSHTFLMAPMLQAIQRFTVLELSNFYLDVAKDRLYVRGTDSHDRR